jgi:uncharacterized protein (TIGR03086 family)
MAAPPVTALAPAERHRRFARTFAERVRGTRDWEAPAPVAGWTARDVVRHLVEWFPPFLAAGGIDLPAAPSVDADPVGAWQSHADAVQSLLDDSRRSGEPFTHPRAGPSPSLADAIDRFYTADVFMHTWDLARATGQDDRLDPGFCAELLAGAEPHERAMRDSGQYGPRVQVPENADPQTRLLGFIGRDPEWRRPG